MPTDLNCWGCQGAIGGVKRFATVSAMLIHLESGTYPVGWTIQHINALALEASWSIEYIIRNRVPWMRAGAPSQIARETDYRPRQSIWSYSICRSGYLSRSDLTEHLQSCQSIKGFPDVLKCPECPDRFTTLSGMLQHIETPKCPASKDTRSIAKLFKALMKGLGDLDTQVRLSEIRYKLVGDPNGPGKLMVTVAETHERTESCLVPALTPKTGYARLICRA
ncbi:hypothetical protein MMC28_000546 [Mycoblastus sanguinarius]|nr:hypothetical protein [Mycoblastus sanguinarius]